VDADLSKYFDTIPHSALMTSVARRVSDGPMLRLIKQWLKAPVVEADECGHRRMSGGKKATRGTPQGGVASPLLANIYMHRFIKAFRQHGLDRRSGAVLVNYADDFVILCRHGAAAVLETTRRWMTRIGLALNEDKTRLLDAAVRRLRLPRLHLRPDVLASDRRTLQRCAAIEEGRRVHQRRHSSAAAAGKSGTVGGRRPRFEPHRAGLVQLLLLRYGHESAARCGATRVPHRPSLSAPPAQDRRVWLSAVSHAGRLWGTGRRVAADPLAAAAAHAVT